MVAGDVSRQPLTAGTALNRIAVSAVMVVHNNEDGSLTRFLRDLLPALRVLRPVLDAELIIVDNSVSRRRRNGSRRRREADSLGGGLAI